jgi:lysophospholipase L1-like esterase
VIIIQLGIVDAVRRVSSPLLLRIISKIPLIRFVFRYFAKKYHFSLTKLLNIHYADEKRFLSNLENFKHLNENSKIIPILIAPPGTYLRENTYMVEADIKSYNNIIKKIFRSSINPYHNEESDTFLREDGHHLNDKGHLIVYENLKRVLIKNKII